MAVCLSLQVAVFVPGACRPAPFSPSGDGEEDGGRLGLVLWGLAGLLGMEMGGECSWVEGCCDAVFSVVWIRGSFGCSEHLGGREREVNTMSKMPPG